MNRDGHVKLLDDLEHAVDVLLRVGDEDRVVALEHLEEAVRVLEALCGLLRVLCGHVLEPDELADHASLLGKAVRGDVHQGADALGAHRLALEGAEEVLVERLDHHAVHRERRLDGQEIGLLVELASVGRERDLDLGEVRRGEEHLLRQRGVLHEHELERRVLEIEDRHAVRPLRDVLELLGDRLRLGRGLLLLGGGAPLDVVRPAQLGKRRRGHRQRGGHQQEFPDVLVHHARGSLHFVSPSSGTLPFR